MNQNWAWQSREFLREKIIGKVVILRVEHTHEGGRRIGEAFLGEEDLRQTVVKNGWADVPRRRDQSGAEKPLSKEDERLIHCSK